MRRVLGIAIGADEIRVLLVESNTVRWHASVPCRDIGSVARALTDLLDQTAKVCKRSRIAVVLSPTWVQVKPLYGLPAVKPARLANQLVRENQQAFFLWKATSRLIADIHGSPGGAQWGAAFDKAMIGEITGVLRSKGVSITRVTPSVVALVAAVPKCSISWADGGDRFELEGDAGGVRRIERRLADTDVAADAATEVTLSMLPTPLDPLGADAARFLDAYAAAVTARHRLPLAWHIESPADRVRAWARVCQGTTVMALAGAAGFAVFAPGIRAADFARRTELELARQHQIGREVARGEAELHQVSQALNRVEAFRAERGRITRILGELSQSLPESTAMLTFHVDSVEGGFTAMAPHVADVLPELANVSQMAAPRIVGSVTREVLAGAHIERAAFRFRRSRPRANPIRRQ